MPEPGTFSFSTVPGYFLQDESSTDPDSFDYVCLPQEANKTTFDPYLQIQANSNFGLIDRDYDSQKESKQELSTWQRFSREIQHLNELGGELVRYKVLFLGRHGEGVHNVAEARYGTKAWDEYWSFLDGDEYGRWDDARLTDLGKSQAETAHSAWKKQIEHGIPAPQSYYVSPLNRCCTTAQITFDGLDIPLTKPFRPTIKELLRETIGQHTCDRRSKASEIACEFPEYGFEAGFEEKDLLWDPIHRESNEDRNKRLSRLLGDIFANDDNIFLSLTAHSGAITSILEVIGHRKFQLQTGGVIPVVIRAEKVST
ncbi:hypothetical protein N7495_008588 [Penicillium taxi]|uniref:uncharacterized protein n=1 Tax=Penicillium taxi TaxID=168475 RepID=UPI002544FB8F|nr:uncharacterized protein N7495_008588 [Penicillium taxi]KAJ5888547.1 hypothetical protein N7495_008588 [Penicillium taxi]